MISHVATERRKAEKPFLSELQLMRLYTNTLSIHKYIDIFINIRKCVVSICDKPEAARMDDNVNNRDVKQHNTT